MNKDEICRKISMPERIKQYLEDIYTPFDLQILDETDEDGYVVKKYRRSWLEHLYKRGILDKIEGDLGEWRYKACDVDMRLECFIVHEKAYWISLPQEVRDGINWGYAMDPDYWIPEKIAHPERTEYIIPIEDAKDLMENADTEYYYLSECNCNNYWMHCDRDKYDVCIHFSKEAPGVNSPADRGLARRVTKEEAMRALQNAEEQGLIHKAGPGFTHLCNCCTDCCMHHYKTEKYTDGLKDGVIKTPYIIRLDANACINCGACTKRCQFGALRKGEQILDIDYDKCWGCGVCRRVCPKKALTVIKRSEKI